VLSTWDPAQYGRFERERLQAAHDLLARVPLSAPNAIYDLGCGTGNATALIAGAIVDPADERRQRRVFTSIIRLRN